MEQNKQGSMTEQSSSDTGASDREFQHGVGQISSPEGAGMGGAAGSSAQAHASAVSSETPSSSQSPSNESPSNESPSNESPSNESPASQNDPSAGAHPTLPSESPDVERKDPQLEVSTAREPGERGESKE